MGARRENIYTNGELIIYTTIFFVFLFFFMFAETVLTTFFTTTITITLADEALDTREGEDITLKCRFSEQNLNDNFLYYWARFTPPSKYENVAVKDSPLNANYR